MKALEFIEKLLDGGYSFSVLQTDWSVVIEATFYQSFFEDGELITPPAELPNLPHKIAAAKRDECDDFGITFIWTFEIKSLSKK